MSAQDVRTFRRTPAISLFLQALLALGLAALTLIVASTLLVLGMRAVYTNRVLPGVDLQGVPLGGLSSAEVVDQVDALLTFPQEGHIALIDGDRVWEVAPIEVGIWVDGEAIARRALAVGREGGLLQRIEEQIETWYGGHPIEPVLVLDELVAGFKMGQIAAEIDQPTIEAAITLEGTTVRATPGQIGRKLDMAATLEALRKPAREMVDAALVLPVVETPPQVIDASAEARAAQSILSAPLRFLAEGEEVFSLSPSDVAPMLRFSIADDGQGTRYDISLDGDELSTLLEPLAPDLERSAENARFIFNDDTRQLDLLRPAVIGRSLDISGTLEAAHAALARGDHDIEMAFHFEQPEVGDQATAEELGISEPVSVVSSYFYGSSPERVHNIQTASAAFHGLLIPPGGVLSMAEVLGDISLDTGYAEALIIYGDRTIKGVGGGVCQVSTTLFRAAFFGGYEIVERNPHAYRVGYYEQGPGSPGPGLDATVFVPLVDFKFRNDSSSWLLMETYIYGNQLLWKFYSTSDGREVTWSSKISGEVEAPKPLYRKNPDLDKNEFKQIDYEADGMDVVVFRTVTRDGKVLHQDTIKTHYLPWRAIFEYGPGSDLPDDVEVEES